jgi:uncharacterized integral membrane protein
MMVQSERSEEMTDNFNEPGPGSIAAGGKSGPNITLIALGVVAVLGVVFFLQNSEPVSIDFWFFEKRTTIRWSILMAFLFGVVCDRLLSIWWRRRGKKKQKNDTK